MQLLPVNPEPSQLRALADVCNRLTPSFELILFDADVLVDFHKHPSIIITFRNIAVPSTLWLHVTFSHIDLEKEGKVCGCPGPGAATDV